MEHTVANLYMMTENISASRSRIEDTDYAKQSANLANASILNQASTTMLTQANQQQQLVIQLLKDAA
jgi:flagellin